jgi:hypothetical protein
MRSRKLVVPQTLKPPRAELYVPYGVPDVLMAEVRLNQPKVRAAFGQVVAARMPEGVRVRVQGSQASTFRHAIYHQLNPARCHRSASLGDENEVAGLDAFALQSSQSANFHSPQAMIARYATLGAPDVENPLIEIELVPVGL